MKHFPSFFTFLLFFISKLLIECSDCTKNNPPICEFRNVQLISKDSDTSNFHSLSWNGQDYTAYSYSYKDREEREKLISRAKYWLELKSKKSVGEFIRPLFCIFDKVPEGTTEGKLYMATLGSHESNLKFWITSPKRDLEKTKFIPRIFIAQIISAIDILENYFQGKVPYLLPENIVINSSGLIQFANLMDLIPQDPEKAVLNRRSDREALYYMSPEYLTSKYDFSGPVDCMWYWSLGVIIYQIRTKKFPFNTKEEIMDSNFIPPLLEGIKNASLKQLIQGLLKRDPKERIGCSWKLNKIGKTLRAHLYFKLLDWKMISRGYMKYPKPYKIISLNKGKSYCNRSDYIEGEELKFLGKGTFGRVFKVVHSSSGKEYALKKPVSEISERKQKEGYYGSLKEFYTLQDLQEKIPYLNPVFCAWSDEGEYGELQVTFLLGLAKGDLSSRIKSLKKSPLDLERILGEIVYGLHLMHQMGFGHFDFKGGNVLVSRDNHAWISDVGMTTYLEPNEYLTKDQGTAVFAAPEVTKRQKYRMCVDWWAFGVMVYNIYTGDYPFKKVEGSKSNWDMAFDPEPSYEKIQDSNLKDLLQKLFKRSVSERLGCKSNGDSDGQAIMDHPFFKNLDWNKIKSFKRPDDTPPPPPPLVKQKSKESINKKEPNQQELIKKKSKEKEKEKEKIPFDYQKQYNQIYNQIISDQSSQIDSLQTKDGQGGAGKQSSSSTLNSSSFAFIKDPSESIKLSLSQIHFGASKKKKETKKMEGRGGKSFPDMITEFDAFHLPTNSNWSARRIPLNHHLGNGKEGSFREKALIHHSRLLSQFNHPYILRNLGYLKESNFLILLEEPCKYGNLRRAIQEDALDGKTVKRYASEMMEALSFLHQFGYAYLQLSPDTIMIGNDGHLKLSDMSLTLPIPTGQAIKADGRGRFGYMAPETVNMNDSYRMCVDWWSFAITLFEMATGERPFPPLLTNEPEEAGNGELNKKDELGNLENSPSPPSPDSSTTTSNLDSNKESSREDYSHEPNWKLIKDVNLRDLLKRMLTMNRADRLGCDPIYGMNSNFAAINEHEYFRNRQGLIQIN